jgi:formate hydrogenlyase transcriptional activator
MTGGSVDELAALSALADGISAEEGGLFNGLARCLATAVGARHALVAELTGPRSARPLGWWGIDRLSPGSQLELRVPLAEAVARGDALEQLDGMGEAPISDAVLGALAIESFLVAPVSGPAGQPLGLLCAFDGKAMAPDPRRVLVLRILAARAGAELARQRAETALAEAQIYQDLYEEAPIAYVREDLESRFLSANRAALRILGLRPDQVVGNVGIAMVPQTPDAQRRVQEAFESIGRGTDTAGVVLELRRKDDGRQIWIQWWSKPEANGKYTRTMFVDITERVLMEQEQARLRAQNLYLQEEIKSVHNFEEIVGRSPTLLGVLEKVERVAKTDATVLITGETGSGKELIARAIHSTSRRFERPLIKLNCAALPTGLVESELFGHEKGAFSGALQRRVGRFELANGGTIFLDEIGEMALDVQVKLLRVLQEREFERVGGSETIKVDVRVLAASNRDLRKAVLAGQFREDLFYRLNVFPVELPPLRERAADIPLLVRFFVGKYGVLVDRQVDSVDADTMKRLVEYRWPGNIRELQNLVERALILSTTTELHIEPEIFASGGPPPSVMIGAGRDLATLQRERILEALREAGWVIEGERGAARQLGLHPNTLRSRIRKLGLERSSQ